MCSLASANTNKGGMITSAVRDCQFVLFLKAAFCIAAYTPAVDGMQVSNPLMTPPLNAASVVSEERCVGVNEGILLKGSDL